MKKGYKVLFALLIVMGMFFSTKVVKAETNYVTITGGLWNKIEGTKAKRNTLQNPKKVNMASFYSKIEQIENIDGNKSITAAGIRVKNYVQRYTSLFSSTTAEDEIIVYLYQGTRNNNRYWDYYYAYDTIVKWENWTGDTSFDGVFRAYLK